MSASAGGGGSIGSPRGKGKREPAADSAFEFCRVCNLNHNQARKHRYFPNHLKALSRFLSRFQDKLSELRFFLNNPSPRRPEHSALNRLWCVFCDAEIVELGSSFVCSNAIHHLASSDHLKQLKNFLWKYGGGMHHVPSFIISEADLIKWEKKCEESKTAHSISGGANVAGPMLSEDIQNDFSLRNKSKSVETSILSFEKNFSPAVQPLQNHTIDLKKRLMFNYMESTACSSSSNILEQKKVVGAESSSDIRPPWLEESENAELIPGDKKKLNINSSVKAGTSRKLNPNRVGAAWADRRRLEIEMERKGLTVASDYHDDWLPNFGRVWQEGTRKDSRKEFEKEKIKSPDADSEVSTKLQPYISKRMRLGPVGNIPDIATRNAMSCLRTELEENPSKFQN